MAEIIKPLQESVNIDATVGKANFASSFSNMALTPTMLGEMGSQIATTASNTLMTKMGYEAGKNPSGDLLPPITKADEVYKAAYESQSANSIILQLNSMLNKANEQLSSSYNLTPEMIQDYGKQMLAATGQIIENAPTAIKGQLAYHYGSQIQQTQYNYNLKLTNQNKEKAIDEMNLADKQTDIDIINQSMSGNKDKAVALYQNKIKKNEEQVKSGMMSKTQAFTSNEAAKLSLYTAESNAKALEARNKSDKDLEKYLTSLSDFKNKPEELTFEQYAQVGRNTLGFMGHMDQLQLTERNDLLSTLDNKLETGELTEQDIETARTRGVIKDTDINKLTAKWSHRLRTQTKNQNELLAASDSFSNAEKYATQSTAKQNEAYKSIVEKKLKENPRVNPGEIEAEVAAAAGGPNQQFFKTLTGLSRSAIPEQLAQASSMYHIVKGRSPQNIIGLPQNTEDTIRGFDAFRELNPGNDAAAAAQTRQAMMPKTQDQADSNKQIWDDYYKNNLSTPADRASYARKTLSANGYLGSIRAFGALDVLKQNEQAVHITKILERYSNLFDGDIAAATLATEKAVQNIYGETYSNGAKQVAKFPIEKYTNFGRQSTFFIQNDIIDSLQGQFNRYKEAYDAGDSDFYYRVKNADQWSLSNVESKASLPDSIKQEIDKIDNRLKEIHAKGYYSSMANEDEYQALFNKRNKLYANEFKSAQQSVSDISQWENPIEIEQVYRGKDDKDGLTETYSLNVNASENASYSYDTSRPIIGDYDIFLTNKNGAVTSIQALAGIAMTPVMYTPNFNKIRSNTAAFINATGGHVTFDKAFADYKEAVNKYRNDFKDIDES